MTFLWLIAWLCQGTPRFALWDSSWAIGLAVCAAIDLIAAISRR